MLLLTLITLFTTPGSRERKNGGDEEVYQRPSRAIKHTRPEEMLCVPTYVSLLRLNRGGELHPPLMRQCSPARGGMAATAPDSNSAERQTNRREGQPYPDADANATATVLLRLGRCKG